MRFRILAIVIALAVIAAASFGARKLVKSVTTQTGPQLPSTKVRRGRVTISVTARGELQGGNTEMIVVPPTGADSTAITSLREPGEMVEAGDVVVEFDTTLQEYNLREAQANVKRPALEVRTNKVQPALVARQNDIALDAASGRLRQAEQNLANKTANTTAGVAIRSEERRVG